MKIAFTSCACAILVNPQPVWDDIRKAAPDHVVLLGDNIYNDVPSPGIAALKAMGDWEFAEHLYARYAQQLAESRFRALVATPGITMHAIWDDHDFAWDNACGGLLLQQPDQAEKVKLSTAFLKAFRRALAAKDLSTFPASAGDAAFWADYHAPVFTPVGATSMPLEPSGRSWLHLSDGRTQRTSSTILGPAQRAQLTGAFAAHPSALHILASGSTYTQADGWIGYATDFQWLKGCLGEQAWLMLSGDIHSSGLLIHRGQGAGRLVEATASGAAIVAYLNPYITGPELRNYGMLEIGTTKLTVSFFAFGKVVTSAVFARRPGGDLVVAERVAGSIAIKPGGCGWHAAGPPAAAARPDGR